MKKKKKFHSCFVNEPKRLSFVLYSIQGSRRKTKLLRNFISKFRADSEETLVEIQKLSFL